MIDRNQLAADNVNLIHGYLLKHPPPWLNGMDYDDWYAVAADGYMDAVAAYDESRGAFATVAYVAMRHAICKCIQSSNYNLRKLNNTAISLDAKINDDDKFSVADTIAAPDNVVESATERIERELFQRACSLLDDTDRRIIDLRWRGVSLKTIGGIIGVTGESIRIRENNAIRKMQKIIGMLLQHYTDDEIIAEIYCDHVAMRNDEIIRRYDSGMSRMDISRTMGVSYAVVSNCIYRNRGKYNEHTTRTSPYEQLFYSDYIGGLSIHDAARKRSVSVPEALEIRQKILAKGWELPKIESRISDRTKILCGAGGRK